MTPAKQKSNTIKHILRDRHGLTLTALAKQYHWRFRDVSDVVRGVRAGYYGTGRDISRKITELTGVTMPVDDVSTTTEPSNV